MVQLLKNDWIISPSVQVVSKITNDQSDHYYHSHDFFEIFYVLDGSITHCYNGIKERLSVGDMRLLRPTDKHNFIRKKGHSCAHRDIIISEQFFKKSCEFINPELLDLITNHYQPLKTKISQTTLIDLEKKFSQAFFAPIGKGIYSKESIMNILSIELLNIFLQEFQTNSNYMPAWLNAILPSFSTPSLMREGINFIIKDLNYDKSYLCRTFKKYMGCTMTDYLRDQRIEYAATLLLNTDKTVAQICEEVGFSSIPYFTDCFKHKYSLSPKQFRLNHFQQMHFE